MRRLRQGRGALGRQCHARNGPWPERDVWRQWHYYGVDGCDGDGDGYGDLDEWERELGRGDGDG